MHLGPSQTRFILQENDVITFNISKNRISFMRKNQIYFIIGGNNEHNVTNMVNKSPWMCFYQADAFMYIISVATNCKYTELLRTETRVAYRIIIKC